MRSDLEGNVGHLELVGDLHHFLLVQFLELFVKLFDEVFIALEQGGVQQFNVLPYSAPTVTSLAAGNLARVFGQAQQRNGLSGSRLEVVQLFQHVHFRFQADQVLGFLPLDHLGRSGFFVVVGTQSRRRRNREQAQQTGEYEQPPHRFNGRIWIHVSASR